MRLPDRLDYESERDDDGERFPVVTCTAPNCRWVFHAAWSDLADDGDVDWDAEHPAHAVVPA